MMDISVIADTVIEVTQQGVGFSNSLLHRQICISNGNFALSGRFLQSADVILDALAPPPVTSNSHKTAHRTLLRRKRGCDLAAAETTRMMATISGFGGDGDGDGLLSGLVEVGAVAEGGILTDLADKIGTSWSSSSEFAYGFIYEVIYWIALSTCTHFAFEKVVRIMADGIDDAEGEKVPMRLASVC